jgi:hypothetical protein
MGGWGMYGSFSLLKQLKPNQLSLPLTARGRLLLLGGNAINTGQLSAPSHSIMVAAVPGTSRVRISQFQPGFKPRPRTIDLPDNSNQAELGW